MKSGIFLSSNPDLLSNVASAVALRVEVVFYAAEGFYAMDPNKRLFWAEVYEWFQDGVLQFAYELEITKPGPGVSAMPEMLDLTIAYFECRWDDWVIEIAGELARRVPEPVYLWDGNGVLWLAQQIDPSRLSL